MLLYLQSEAKLNANSNTTLSSFPMNLMETSPLNHCKQNYARKVAFL